MVEGPWCAWKPKLIGVLFSITLVRFHLPSFPSLPLSLSFLFFCFQFIHCRHHSNLMGFHLFLRRIRCCYSFCTLYNHWLSYVSLSLLFLLLLGVNGYCQLHFSFSSWFCISYVCSYLVYSLYFSVGIVVGMCFSWL